MSAKRSRPTRSRKADSVPKGNGKSPEIDSSKYLDLAGADTSPICCNLGDIHDAAVRLMGLDSLASTATDDNCKASTADGRRPPHHCLGSRQSHSPRRACEPDSDDLSMNGGLHG